MASSVERMSDAELQQALIQAAAPLIIELQRRGYQVSVRLGSNGGQAEGPIIIRRARLS